jgi:hypothetical protein
MTLVAVPVILFSVVFPALKMLALGACLFRPALLCTNRVVWVLAAPTNPGLDGLRLLSH